MKRWTFWIIGVLFVGGLGAFFALEQLEQKIKVSLINLSVRPEAINFRVSPSSYPIHVEVQKWETARTQLTGFKAQLSWGALLSSKGEMQGSVESVILITDQGSIKIPDVKFHGKAEEIKIHNDQVMETVPSWAFEVTFPKVQWLDVVEFERVRMVGNLFYPTVLIQEGLSAWVNVGGGIDDFKAQGSLSSLLGKRLNNSEEVGLEGSFSLAQDGNLEGGGEASLKNLKFIIEAFFSGGGIIGSLLKNLGDSDKVSFPFQIQNGKLILGSILSISLPKISRSFSEMSIKEKELWPDPIYPSPAVPDA